jgi:hypothetical protein
MFVKGQSGNPGGRPKKDISLTNILKRQAEKKDVEYNGQKIKRKDAIAQKIWQLALSGDLTAMKYIFDRIDGKPVETIKQHITEENPIHDMIRGLVSAAEPDST